MSWRETTLGECARFQSGGTPRKAVAEYWNGDIPWVGSGEMSESFIWDTALRVTREGAENGSRLVPENTVLVVVRGMSLAKEFRISLTMREMTFNQDVKALVCTEGITPRFLFYALKARKDHIRDLATDASHGTKKLETDQLKAVAIKVPESVDDQEEVASILSAYDDLIENNRRRIGLLEQAARLLYREWFVHLRFPGHETVNIVDGLPEGWSRGSISDLFDTSSGGTPSRKNDGFFGGNINWLKTQELENCFIFETDEQITEDGLKHSSAKMFPENTVIVAMYGATIGQLAILAQASSTNQACCALIPKRAPDDYLFAYCLMEHSAKTLKDLGQGAAQNNVSQQVIRAMEIVIPSHSVLDIFNASILNNFQQRRNLQAQNIKLTRARDLLLPRLMDGRIPV